jgi:hypothetical protein
MNYVFNIRQKTLNSSGDRADPDKVRSSIRCEGMNILWGNLGRRAWPRRVKTRHGAASRFNKPRLVGHALSASPFEPVAGRFDLGGAQALRRFGLSLSPLKAARRA